MPLKDVCKDAPTMASGRTHDGEPDEGSHNIVRDSKDLDSNYFDSLEYGDEDFESEGTPTGTAAESRDAGGGSDNGTGAADTHDRARACASEGGLGDGIAVDEDSEGTGFRIVKTAYADNFQVDVDGGRIERISSEFIQGITETSVKKASRYATVTSHTKHGGNRGMIAKNGDDIDHGCEGDGSHGKDRDSVDTMKDGVIRKRSPATQSRQFSGQDREYATEAVRSRRRQGPQRNNSRDFVAGSGDGFMTENYTPYNKSGKANDHHRISDRGTSNSATMDSKDRINDPRISGVLSSVDGPIANDYNGSSAPVNNTISATRGGGGEVGENLDGITDDVGYLVLTTSPSREVYGDRVAGEEHYPEFSQQGDRCEARGRARNGDRSCGVGRGRITRRGSQESSRSRRGRSVDLGPTSSSSTKRKRQEQLIQQLARNNSVLKRKVAGFQLALELSTDDDGGVFCGSPSFPAMFSAAPPAFPRNAVTPAPSPRVARGWSHQSPPARRHPGREIERDLSYTSLVRQLDSGGKRLRTITRANEVLRARVENLENGAVLRATQARLMHLEEEIAGLKEELGVLRRLSRAQDRKFEGSEGYAMARRLWVAEEELRVSRSTISSLGAEVARLRQQRRSRSRTSHGGTPSTQKNNDTITNNNHSNIDGQPGPEPRKCSIRRPARRKPSKPDSPTTSKQSDFPCMPETPGSPAHGMGGRGGSSGYGQVRPVMKRREEKGETGERRESGGQGMKPQRNVLEVKAELLQRALENMRMKAKGELRVARAEIDELKAEKAGLEQAIEAKGKEARLQVLQATRLKRVLRDLYVGVAKLEEASVVVASHLPEKQTLAASIKAKAAASAEVAAAAFPTESTHIMADERRARSAASAGGGGPLSSFSNKSTAFMRLSKPLDPRHRSAPSARCSPAQGGGMTATAAAGTTSTTTTSLLSNDPSPPDPRNRDVSPMEWNRLWEGQGCIGQGVDAPLAGAGIDGDRALTMITIGDGVERCREAAWGGQEGTGRSTAEGVIAHTGQRGGGAVERKVGAMGSGEGFQQQQVMLECAVPIAVKHVSLPARRATPLKCPLVGIMDMMEPPSGKRSGDVSSPRFSMASGLSATREEDTTGGEAQDPASLHEKLNCSIDLQGVVWHADRCLLTGNTGTAATLMTRTRTATNIGRQGSSGTNTRTLGCSGSFAGNRDNGAGGLERGARTVLETPRHVDDGVSHGQLNDLRGSMLQSDPGWVEEHAAEPAKALRVSLIGERPLSPSLRTERNSWIRPSISTVPESAG